MATTTADFKLSDFDLTASTLTPVTDDYGTTWTLVNPRRSSIFSYGSSLQKPPTSSETYSDDTALRGDAYVDIPQLDAIVVDAFFEAKPVDYGVVKLKWSAGVPLSSTYGATPTATEIIIRWDTLGEPQTVANGYSVITISADDPAASEMEHVNLPDGAWVYYSIFVKYSSTAYRHWYEKVGSVHVQTPYRYGSTDMLWGRIPRHYRIQDDLQYSSPSALTELTDKGPLYRLLNVFGWDIDRIRTLAHHQMVTRDPMLATTEALDTLAAEMGLSMSSVDLGTERLRNYLNDVGYLRQSKGTIDGIRETITAITGSDVIIEPTVSNRLSELQAIFSAGVTVTTSASVAPADSGWVFYSPSSNVSASVDAPNGVMVSTTSPTGYDLVVAKTKISKVNQASWYNLFYDSFGKTAASVSAVAFTASPTSAASVTVDQDTGYVVDLPPEAVQSFSVTDDDWYQIPVALGLSGNGTFTEEDMYLYIFFVLGPSGTITLNNVRVQSDDRYPYQIKVFSQRLNLCRDPQFFYGTGSNYYWEYTTSGGTVNQSNALKRMQFESTGASTTSASVTLNTNLHTGPADTHIPVQVGIPYYFTITDTYEHVHSVSLISATYGTIATATETFAERLVSNKPRKTWRLFREYEAPWLPKNLNDCYLEVLMIIPGGETCIITQPLLEPVNPLGEYFDGDNVNGGWLSGPTASSGVADYRWGDAGQHASFSYYTSDYRRTVVATHRLLDTIVPVTQTDDPATLVVFDRVYGYEGEDRP